MNKFLLPAFSIIAATASGFGAAASAPGIAAEVWTSSVTLRLEPGAYNGGRIDNGRFLTEVGYVYTASEPGINVTGPLVTGVTLNVYRVQYVSNGQTVTPKETRIFTGSMARLSPIQAAVMPRPGDKIQETFFLNASSVSNQQGSLLKVGELYRAEVVVKRTAPGGPGPLAGFEPAAADALFWMSNVQPPAVKLSSVSGRVLVSATNTPKKNATAAQKRALIKREILEFRKAQEAITARIRQHGSGAAPGQAPRAAWSWSGSAQQQIWPPRNNTSYTVTSGQVYTSAKASVTSDFNAAANTLSKTYTLRGGTVKVTVTNQLAFRDL